MTPQAVEMHMIIILLIIVMFFLHLISMYFLVNAYAHIRAVRMKLRLLGFKLEGVDIEKYQENISDG
jgi:hypothetical protein